MIINLAVKVTVFTQLINPLSKTASVLYEQIKINMESL